MKLVKNYSYKYLIETLLGKTVNFISDCDFFPNFNVKGKVIAYRLVNNELVFKLRTTKSNKLLDIGINMKNLKFKIL